jgi:hypothetical protein
VNRGDTGERGPHGDHGQDGLQGADGPTGHDGMRGERGPQGVAGLIGPSVLSKAQTLVMFLFVVACFGGLAYRSELQAHATKHAIVVACERANVNTKTINEFLDLLATNARKSTLLTRAEKAERVRGYEATKVDPIKCR